MSKFDSKKKENVVDLSEYLFSGGKLLKKTLLQKGKSAGNGSPRMTIQKHKPEDDGKRPNPEDDNEKNNKTRE